MLSGLPRAQSTPWRSTERPDRRDSGLECGALYRFSSGQTLVDFNTAVQRMLYRG